MQIRVIYVESDYCCFSKKKTKTRCELKSNIDDDTCSSPPRNEKKIKYTISKIHNVQFHVSLFQSSHKINFK